MGNDTRKYESRSAEVEVDRESFIRLIRLLALSLAAGCDGLSMDSTNLGDVAKVKVTVEGAESQDWWMYASSLTPGSLSGVVLLTSLLGDPLDDIYQVVVVEVGFGYGADTLELDADQRVWWGDHDDWIFHLAL